MKDSLFLIPSHNVYKRGSYCRLELHHGYRNYNHELHILRVRTVVSTNLSSSGITRTPVATIPLLRLGRSRSIDGLHVGSFSPARLYCPPHELLPCCLSRAICFIRMSFHVR